MSEVSDDLLKRSDDLDERVAGSDEIESLVRYGHTNRRLIRMMAVSLVVDILLSVALGFVAIRAQEVAFEATSVQRQLRTSCLAGNEARTAQRQLWHHLLDLPASVPRTPEETAQAADLGRYVDTEFAPRKC